MEVRVRKMSLDQQLSAPTPNASNKSACDIPCWGVPDTGHASAFKVISAPQHDQKAATSFHLHNCYDCLDERRKCDDSRPVRSVLLWTSVRATNWVNC